MCSPSHRDTHIMPATSSTRLLKPSCHAYMASYDVVSNVCALTALEFNAGGHKELCGTFHYSIKTGTRRREWDV